MCIKTQVCWFDLSKPGKSTWKITWICSTLAQVRCGVHPAKVKAGEHGLIEGGVEGVKQSRCSTGDREEGQSPSWPVQVDSYLTGACCSSYRGVHAPVQAPVAIFGAVQTPGGVIPSQPGIRALSLPAHSFVGHSNADSPSPFYLPVAAPHLSLLTQHLCAEVEPLRVVRVRLLGPS